MIEADKLLKDGELIDVAYEAQGAGSLRGVNKRVRRLRRRAAKKRRPANNGAESRTK